MATRLTYRFEPLADLFSLLLDPQRVPSSASWQPAREAMGRCLRALFDAAGESNRAVMAFHGLICEATSIDELLSWELPDESVLGLPWALLVELAVAALEQAQPLYETDIASTREQTVTTAIDRLRRVLGPHEDACLTFVHDGLEFPDGDRDIPVVLVGSIPFPGAFTSLSDVHGAICFVGVEGLTGTSLAETVLHEATHAIEWTSPARRSSVLGRLASAVHRTFGTDPNYDQVTHSLIFVHAGETVRRIVDPSHVHYGVSHTYYDRVPVSKPVLAHWVAHLDGAYDADEAIERIVRDLLVTRAT